MLTANVQNLLRTAKLSAAPLTAKLIVTSVCPFSNRDKGQDTSGTIPPLQKDEISKLVKLMATQINAKRFWSKTTILIFITERNSQDEKSSSILTV